MTIRTSRRFVAALAATALILPTLAFADDHRPPGQGSGPQGHDQRGAPQGQGSQHQQSGGQPPHGQQSHNERPEFRYDESRYARDYFHDHKWEAPRPKHRPYVGYKLPRDYRHPLPPDLRGRFHPRPGYDYYMVGDDIVLAVIATGLIVDILVNVH